MNKFSRYRWRKRFYRFLGLHWWIGVPLASIAVVFTIISFIRPYVVS